MGRLSRRCLQGRQGSMIGGGGATLGSALGFVKRCVHCGRGEGGEDAASASDEVVVLRVRRAGGSQAVPAKSCGDGCLAPGPAPCDSFVRLERSRGTKAATDRSHVDA